MKRKSKPLFRRIRVRLADLKPGPLRHLTLPPALIARIREVYAVFHEFDGQPIEKWFEDFQRDATPEREIRIWECLLYAYRAFTTGKTLNLETRKEIHRLLLYASLGCFEEACRKNKLLSESDVAEIIAAYIKADKEHPVDYSPVSEPISEKSN